MTREQTTDADCIRRSDVGLTDFEIVMCNGDYKEGLKMLLDKIENAPSVTPHQKMGKWITTRTFMHDGEYYCDRCKCDAPNNEKWDYCPNCGSYNGGEG